MWGNVEHGRMQPPVQWRCQCWDLVPGSGSTISLFSLVRSYITKGKLRKCLQQVLLLVGDSSNDCIAVGEALLAEKTIKIFP